MFAIRTLVVGLIAAAALATGAAAASADAGWGNSPSTITTQSIR